MSGERRLKERSPASCAVRPPALGAVLQNSTSDGPEPQAWKSFLDNYSRVILHVASRVTRTYDERMNLYAHVVDELSRDGCRRLRAYEPTEGAKFTSWLIVVARRLCIDYRRRRYGRAGADEGDAAIRRRLEDLVCEQVDIDLEADEHSRDPESEIRRTELRAHLYAVIGDLAVQDRLMLTLRFVDKRSAKEIALAVGLSSQWQVYRRLNAVVDRLRQQLNGRGVHDGAP